mmetsp:Transcript_25188/g.18975  ORF Transcript_25188/g.18975 Transcript_25188/m.18975 type:complete len:83 (-) Transcript_25188:1210-1458(-)
MRKISQFLNEKGKGEGSGQEGVQEAFRVAKEVFRLMTETTEEGRQKNIFGRYKSTLVKDWQLLIRIYESDNLYLAELGKYVQ